MNYFKLNTFKKPLKLFIIIRKKFLNKVNKLAHTYTVLPPGLGLGGSEWGIQFRNKIQGSPKNSEIKINKI